MNAGMPDPAVDKLRAERKSLLDFVGRPGEVPQPPGRRGQDVGRRHLESIRALEKQLAAPQQSIGACGGVMWSGDPAKPIDINTANTPVLWTLQMQLIVAALKCDVTRVGTTQVGDATGGRIIFDFVPGVPRQGNGYQPTGTGTTWVTVRCAAVSPTATTRRRSTSGPWASSPSCSPC